MGCTTYIDKYLSAHVDGELNTVEAAAVEQHLKGCASCRMMHAEERAVKALVSERAERFQTPVQVRGSILAALDAVDEARSGRHGSAPRAEHARHPILRSA